jgi:ABC-2 type transport system permease protein
MKSLQRIHAVVAKELRQLRRDRLTFAMIVGMPIMQLLLFGYAINMDVRHLPAAYTDLANSSASRQFIMDTAQSPVSAFTFRRTLTAACSSPTAPPCS